MAKLHWYNTILQGWYDIGFWIVPVAFAVIGLLAGGVALRTRMRRANRLQLRLLAGRRRLLGEEIDSRSESMADIDQHDLAAHRGEAEQIINGLQLAMLEREAHLQNLQDLAHLQQHKITVLEHRMADVAQPDIAKPSVTLDREPEPQPAGESGILDRREDVEDRFLGAIQKRGAPEPKRGRRGRR